MRKPGVLVIHNRYRQASGEDAVVDAEIELLRSNGHRVTTYIRDNAAIQDSSLPRKALLFAHTSWNRQAYDELQTLITREQPDVAHCHNLLPLISPAAYSACQSKGVPVVQTLHNYRLLCPAGTLFRRGRVCRDCTRNLGLAATRGCYRNSRLQSAAVATMLAVHRRRGTWERSIDAYITLSQFCRDQFSQAGLPAGKLHVKPNFLSAELQHHPQTGDYAVFAGRLSHEKGVLEMLVAWRETRDIPLVVIGDGPLRAEVHEAVRQLGDDARFLGPLELARTRDWIGGARLVVVPSRWHEPFGMTLIEAASAGVPVIAARTGGIPEIVLENETGLLFDPEDFGDLQRKLRWAWLHPAELAAMGAASLERFRQRYSADANYSMLMNIYQAVLSNSNSQSHTDHSYSPLVY